ncbi:hypothetical protein [Streptomyces poonensis]|uniref:Uncharacterized protein n=1 Tax=Streptomyces poonensis TaxID=68255 RepID=A0A918QBT6_9ACTN|nr:hypothetical protein [Streptomyces poonensis]GGZ38582.1 hypothetical protein GCM10010365_69180 [Streptomyces poonensis]GLJ92061.1 hypothetical protein GCM10017589_46700 [Streptomyces poonensis]
MLEELERRGPYECGLAVVAAAVGRDIEWTAGRLGGRTDWPAPWRDVHGELRRHPVPDVRDAALAEVTARE